MKSDLLKLALFAVAVLILTASHSQAQGNTYPNEVKTHIGELTFDHGIPTEETSEKPH